MKLKPFVCQFESSPGGKRRVTAGVASEGITGKDDLARLIEADAAFAMSGVWITRQPIISITVGKENIRINSLKTQKRLISLNNKPRGPFIGLKTNLPERIWRLPHVYPT